MQYQDLEKVSLFLRHFQKRPNMYVKPDIDNLTSFIHGFRLGISLLGLVIPKDIYRDITTERGWNYSSSEFWNQMFDKGCSYEDIVQEFVNTEIEALKRVYDFKE